MDGLWYLPEIRRGRRPIEEAANWDLFAVERVWAGKTER